MKLQVYQLNSITLPSWCSLSSFNFWRTYVLFVGPLTPLFGVSKSELAALFTLGGGVYVACSPRFTSGVTPVYFLVASKAAEPFSSHFCEALVGLETGTNCATAHSVRPGRCSTDWAMPVRPVPCYFVRYTRRSKKAAVISFWTCLFRKRHVSGLDRPKKLYTVT